MAQTSQFRWEGRAWLARTQRNARTGLEKGLEHVLGEARKIIPLDEGTLERSGRVVMDDAAISGAVVFDTVYAVVQHERLDFRHAPGRQAKYLEVPMLAEREVVLAIIAAEIRRGGLLGGLRGG
ncbi:hypothetical protein AB0M28_13430 [Streptomyces sp. NPDC051940]|uniref:hypothetical protein n=1 Tax=Streptomyces sp. NPDC051940 TaxID=3155675 RepID=UPI00342F3D9B